MSGRKIAAIEQTQYFVLKLHEFPAFEMSERIAAIVSDLVRHVDAQQAKSIGAKRSAAAVHPDNYKNRAFALREWA